ncbi:MAG: shikimate dehydrogenase [Patiriisocius sp.]|jgi:shikimate dehydrogenase
MRHFGLIGKTLSHSFSQKFFTEKFQQENISGDYKLFPLEDINALKAVLGPHNLSGFNVTLPYKESIIPLLDDISEEAKIIGAVNTVKITDNGWIGYNTDAFGFKESLKPFLKRHHRKALILGTGGASKAVKYVLDELGLESLFVSRNPSDANEVSYDELNENALAIFPFIINCTPVGTFPNDNEKPNIPYPFLTKNNFLYDLVYNPKETAFIKEGRAHGSQVMNGLNMLHFQAEKAWEIWCSDLNN